MSSRCMVAKVRLVVLAFGTLLLLTSTASAQHRDTFPGNDSLDQQLEAVLLGPASPAGSSPHSKPGLAVASTRSWPMWRACCGLTQSPD
jgi:hypothetical protein